ncbi:hypothetical protein PVAP13_9NG590500 [Panicum virgatum]|uniref:Uncharacterized protein n=1 Tax=Panicum virgatum TaxID=38727 RepID=A0A8T0MZ68_PANVG|nr:hypothetical protein PVAP13_9NG590500 [Panicum virgatum]
MMGESITAGSRIGSAAPHTPMPATLAADTPRVASTPITGRPPHATGSHLEFPSLAGRLHPASSSSASAWSSHVGGPPRPRVEVPSQPVASARGRAPHCCCSALPSPRPRAAARERWRGGGKGGEGRGPGREVWRGRCRRGEGRRGGGGGEGARRRRRGEGGRCGGSETRGSGEDKK